MMTFEELAIQEFPSLINSTSITRKEIKKVIEKHKVKFPNHIANTRNTISRGVYNFKPSTESIEITPKETETEIEMEQRIKETYKSLELFVSSIAKGISPSLIVSGAPGLGKSYTVNKILEQTNSYYVFQRGYLKATHLYRLLWENRNKGETVVIDDCDGIFNDEVALNLLKAALELKETKTIGWGSEKEFVDDNGEQIPRVFEYEGSVIFLTNLDFDDLILKGTKVQEHLKALMSRSLYFDMGIRTNDEILIRIKQVVRETNIVKDKDIPKFYEEKIINYLTENSSRMKDFSLRSVEKIIALIKTDSLNWEMLADAILLRKR